MSNLGVYFEIPVVNLERAIDFYSQVFAVTFSRETLHGCEMAHFSLSNSGLGIGGSLAKGEIYKPTLEGCLIYLSSKDIDTTMKKIIAKGGAELFPKTPVSDLGFSAEFKDSEGNRIGLFQQS